MKIVVDINHPAHIHFFKNFIWEMKKRGHDLLITASEKDVALHLLDHLGFAYEMLGSYGSSLLEKLINLPWLDLKMYQAVRKFSPDIFVGIGSIRATHIAKIMGKKCIIFNDTEHAIEQHILYVPFADVICTPAAFKKDIGKKQIRYDGCHELAYLHPKYFTPNPDVLREMGLSEQDNIFLVRFAAFDATHDSRSESLGKEYVAELINKLDKVGTVIITSEIKLDERYEKYQYKLPVECFHDLLYYARMYVGEGSTSAEEAAILGIPSLHFEKINVDGKSCAATELSGVLNELQNKYGLLYSFCDERALLSKVEEILSDLNRFKSEWEGKRMKFLNENIDVTGFMVWLVENYPDSFYNIKSDPQIQNNFRQVLSI